MKFYAEGRIPISVAVRSETPTHLYCCCVYQLLTSVFDRYINKYVNFWCRIHLRFRKGRCSTVERDVSASRGCDQSHHRTRNHSNAPSTTRWPLSKPQPMTGRVIVFTTELVTDVFYIFNSTVVDWTCYVFFFKNVVYFLMFETTTDRNLYIYWAFNTRT